MLKYQTLKRNFNAIMAEPRLVVDFLQGTGRMKLYTFNPMLIRKHIREQYEWRSRVAAPCTINGSCLVCNCTCPDLFFANKACSLSKIKDTAVRELLAGRSEACYPRLMSARVWREFKQKTNISL